MGEHRRRYTRRRPRRVTSIRCYDALMSEAHDETNRKPGLTLQIQLLQRHLAENEASWKA
jgi:hypothetical protein